MKKITLCFALLAFAFGFAQNGGDDCASAVVITEGSFTDTTINDITPGGNNGDGAWFVYTPTADGTIEISSCADPDDPDTRIFVYDGTCAALNQLILDDDGCGDLSADPDTFESYIAAQQVANGTDYYLFWDDRWGVDPFDWVLTFTAVLCGDVSAVNIYATDFDVTLSWDMPVIGTPISYNWEIQPDGVAQGTAGALASGTTAGLSVNSGMILTPSTLYVAYVQVDCGADGTGNYVSVNFTTNAGPPPANDLCTNATAISCSSTTAFDTTNANLEDDTFCTTSATAEDVWFTYTEGAMGQNITVSTCDDADYDTKIHVFTGGCDAFTCVDGNDDATGCTALTSELTFESSPSTTYYIKVSGFGGNQGTGNLSLTCAALGIDDFDLLGFEYFPNPVNDKLTLRAQSNIQNVAVYNILGQEVMKISPNALSSELDMSTLGQGAYFIKVTINDISETIRIVKK